MVDHARGAKMTTKRKNLVEERYYGMKKRQMNFIRAVQERAAKMQASLAPYFPNDLMFKIFLMLPIKSLLRFRCVCKSWNKLIHCAEFVEAYNYEAQTTAFLMRGVEGERLNFFHVESHANLAEQFSIFPCSLEAVKTSKFIHFLDIEDGKGTLTDINVSCSGSILTSCNGLILIYNKFERHKDIPRTRQDLPPPVFHSQERPGRLIILNPMTRRFLSFPLGTIRPSWLHDHSATLNYNESYGLISCKGGFKVVHLLKDEMGIICEVYCLQTRSWKTIDGPPASHLQDFGNSPIAASGALHWLPDSNHGEYIVSMGGEDERFSVIDLPQTLRRHDKLVDLGGFLSFVSSLDYSHIEVWVLKGLESTDWVKQHTIRIDAILGYVENSQYSIPVFALNAKVMVFRRTEGFYSYDFEHEEIREIEINGGKIGRYETLMPLSGNLATWEPLEPMS